MRRMLAAFTGTLAAVAVLAAPVAAKAGGSSAATTGGNRPIVAMVFDPASSR